MKSFMLFFVKYKLQINFVLVLFWIYIIYDALSSDDFKFQKIIVPLLFILFGIYSISETIKSNKPKSED
jgi:hypothetical protein